MLTIEVPDEVAVPLANQAASRGMTPAAFALDHLRELVTPRPLGSLLEFLGDRVGSIAGTGESYSRDSDRRFADGLAAEGSVRP